MSEINDLFQTISIEERPQFIRYLNVRNRRSDVKNVALFRAMIDGTENNLKSEMGTNAFNVLRNRLKHRMIDFIGQSIIEEEKALSDQLTKPFVVAKRLILNGKTKSAFKLLSALELKAHEHENYGLEGEIQQLLIRHAHLPNAPNLNELHERSSKNLKLQQAHTQLNLAFARIKLAYQAFEFERKEINLSELIRATFEEFTVSDELAYNFSSLHQLIQLADIHGAYTKNYHEVNLFFIEKLGALDGTKSDNAQNAQFHIEILYTIANIYFRKKNFETSLQFLERMKSQMNRFPKQTTSNHELKWSMLTALNFNHLGKAEDARALIDQTLNEPFSSDQTTQLRLVLAMLQIQQSELRECQRTLSKFNHSDAWYEKNLGIEWTLHKLTIEILLHIDLENYDYAESRMKSLFRRYKSFLNKEGKGQAKPFLQLIMMLLRDPNSVQTTAFQSKVEASIEWKSAEEEDVFRINFYAWLKAKMTNSSIYPTLLSLLKST